MDMMMGDDLALNGLMPDRDEVQNLARESIEAAVGPSTFTIGKVDTWTSNIVENCLKRLSNLSKPFKYVVTCNLSQRAGAGMHISSSAYWNTKTDDKVAVTWVNPTVQCSLVVYWVAI